MYWNPSIRPCSSEGSEEYKRLRGLWDQESKACKSHMHALADARTRKERDADACRSIDDVNILDLATGKAVASARRRALKRSLAAVRDHPAWTSGSCTDEYSLGLKPSKLDLTSSCVQVRAAANKMFGYNPLPLGNPQGTAVPETVCAAQRGGLCIQHGFFGLVSVVVKNIYSLLRARGIVKDQLPVMCRVGDDADVVADDPFRRFFIVDIHGAGDNIVCVGLTGCVVLRLPLTITTLHRLVGRRITALVDSISFACYDVVDAERDSGLAITIVGQRFCEAVRTRLVRSKKPASIRLPFGLTLEGPVASIVHIEEADADSCDDSCGFTLAPEASTTGASLSGTDTDVHPPPVVVAPSASPCCSRPKGRANRLRGRSVFSSVLLRMLGANPGG